MTQRNTWQNRVGIVTGGSFCIGNATTLELMAQGAKVLITGRHEEELRAATAMSDAIETLHADSADAENGLRIVEAATAR